MKLNRTGSNWTELERNKINENWSIIEGSYNDVVGQITDEVVGHLIDSAKLIWKEPVDTVDDLPANAEVGETRMVREADPDGISYVYRYDGENWEKIQAIDVTLVNEVDSRLTRQLADKVQKGDLVVNVKDFGAVADARYYNDLDKKWYIDSNFTQIATDNKQAIESALSAVGKYGVVFFPAGSDRYFVSSFTIPKNKDGITLLGAGKRQSRLEFGDLVCVSVQSEMVQCQSIGFDGYDLWTPGTYIFKDDRNTGTADFDLSLFDCYFRNVETVVLSKGRGVTFDRCEFNRIRYQIMDLDFPSKSNFIPGQEDIQKYDTGFRAFAFRNNRVHYAPSVIVRNIGENKKNLTGLQITNNFLEGSVTYIEGYVKDGVVGGNVHYHLSDTRAALFILDGCDNLSIDLNASGMDESQDGVYKEFNSLLRSTGKCNNLTVKANIRNVKEHVFRLSGGGKNILIEVNGKNICTGDSSLYSLVRFLGDVPYEGVVVRGTIDSPGSDFRALVRSAGVEVINFENKLNITGEFAAYDNLLSSRGGLRNNMTGTYVGDGTNERVINVKYEPTVVTVKSDTYAGMKHINTSATAPDIKITGTGFNVSGEANQQGVVYVYSVQ